MYDNVNDYDDDAEDDDDSDDDDDDDDDGDDVDGEDDDDDGDDDDGGDDDDDDADDKVNDDKVKYNDVEKDDDDDDDTLCASLCGRNACQDFTRATLYGDSQEKCRNPDWHQNADTHFARACAVETHVKISQEKWRDPPGSGSLCGRNACQDFTRATFGNLQVKCRRPEWAPWSSTGLYTYQCGHAVWGKI